MADNPFVTKIRATRTAYQASPWYATQTEVASCVADFCDAITTNLGKPYFTCKAVPVNKDTVEIVASSNNGAYKETLFTISLSAFSGKTAADLQAELLAELAEFAFVYHIDQVKAIYTPVA